MLTLILGFVLGGAVIATFFFLGGQLIQQRRQVLEMRQTNVGLFQENQNLKLGMANGNIAYENLKAQVVKIQSGPIAASLSFEQVNQIAEVTAGKLDMKVLRGTELTKKDVN